MQERRLLQICLIALCGTYSQAAAASSKAHYYGHDAVVDFHGVIAPWYQGLNGRCELRVRIAAETLKRYPWTTTNTAVAADPDYVFSGLSQIPPDKLTASESRLPGRNAVTAAGSTSLQLKTAPSLSLGAEEQDGHAEAMLHPNGGSAEHQVGDQLVAVSAHCNQVATVLLDPVDDFFGRLTEGQSGFSSDTRGRQLVADAAKEGFAFLDFLARRVGAVVLGRHAGGHVE
jgi:hypothetical protein